MSFPCIVIDESVDVRIWHALKKDGQNVYPIATYHSCVDDIKIIEVAVIKEALILTEDKDLGKCIINRNSLHKGTLLLQLSGLSIVEKNSLIFNALNNHEDELANAFAVLTPRKLTVRKYFT